MDVMAVTFEIFIVADSMFPEFILPYASSPLLFFPMEVNCSWPPFRIQLNVKYFLIYDQRFE